ncbi:unnamed protein product [Rhizophagus irregularis]|nr:unnamed protein product [Rhizophagus irregularis]
MSSFFFRSFGSGLWSSSVPGRWRQRVLRFWTFGDDGSSVPGLWRQRVLRFLDFEDDGWVLRFWTFGDDGSSVPGLWRQRVLRFLDFEDDGFFGSGLLETTDSSVLDFGDDG